MEDQIEEPGTGGLANPNAGMKPESNEEKADVPEGTRKLVEQWTDKIVTARKGREKTFKQMRENQQFARYGSTKEWHESGKYTVPILARHINQSVATLYARNPKAVATRRPRMMYKVWDGRQDSLQAAMESVQMAMGSPPSMGDPAKGIPPSPGMPPSPPDPNAMAVLQEIGQVRQQNLMLDRMARTISMLWEYYLTEQGTNYKQQLKSAVRRTKVCKVAWVKLGYQRIMEPRPDVIGQINDITSKIASIEATLEEMSEGELEETSAKAEQLRLNLKDLERDKEMVVREGPVLSFPRANQIIVDLKCIHLKSLAGAEWMAEEFEMSPCEIEKVYKIDVKSEFKQYASDGNPYDKKPEECTARVYEVWDQVNLQSFVICEGYCGFLREPATPENWIERFWPYFPIVFNEVEDDQDIYPSSDIEYGKHIQNEYNRSREGLRQHRIAARPFYVTAKGLDKDERDKLANHADHEIIEMPTLAANQKVEDLIQRGPVQPIDPNLYEVEGVFNDLLRGVGTQESQLGGMSRGTATESTIAEQSMSASNSDQVDDLDEMLTDLFRAGGQLMLLNVAKDTVVEIVGPGAVWPDTPQTRSEAAAEIYLEMAAGSSGRPNQAAELAKLERAMPYLQQMPGVNPEPLIRKYETLLEFDPDELVADGMPSMTAINAMMAKMAMGGMGGNPAAEGAAGSQGGAQNAQSTQQNEPGPQPGFPA